LQARCVLGSVNIQQQGYEVPVRDAQRQDYMPQRNKVLVSLTCCSGWCRGVVLLCGQYSDLTGPWIGMSCQIMLQVQKLYFLSLHHVSWWW